MIKLLDWNEEFISRGSVFRCKGSFPYEDVVDFMVVETGENERYLGLMVATGYEAGIICTTFPPEAYPPGTRMLSTNWLKENWSIWCYDECDVEDVYFVVHYQEPKSFHATFSAT